MMTIGVVSALLIVDEVLGEPTRKKRMARLASAVIAMTASCAMLYFKLPDSIRSSVARSAHDYYVQVKKTQLVKTTKAPPPASSQSASSEGQEADQYRAAAGGSTVVRAKPAWPRLGLRSITGRRHAMGTAVRIRRVQAPAHANVSAPHPRPPEGTS